MEISLLEQSHWHIRVKHWANVTPPLRPHADSINRQIELVGADSPRVLVLGVTPELTRGFTNVTAVDKEAVMIEHLWIGDSPTKQAVLADWFTVDLPYNHFTGIVGDGSLNMVPVGEPVSLLMARLFDLLAPGGCLAVRVFSRPAQTVTLQQVLDAVTRLSWHEWRCLLNMHIACTEGSDVPSKRMLSRFNELWPDRQKLCEHTGWSQQEISMSMDSYANSPTRTSYPTQQEWLSLIPSHVHNPRLVQVGTYPLAENYPLLVFEKPL